MPVVTIVLVKVVGEMLDDDQVVVDAQGKGQGGAQGEGQGPQGGEVGHQGSRQGHGWEQNSRSNLTL